MQFSQLWGEVAANFPTANQQRAQNAVNAAYQEFMSARQWSFRESSTTTIALTAGQIHYVLLGTSPVVTDFDGLIDVVLELTSGGIKKPLPEMEQADIDRYFGHCTTNAEPVAYCVQGGLAATSSSAVNQGGSQQLKLVPPPLATAGHGEKLTLRYFRSIASMEMSANTDVPLVPAQYHYALVTGGNANLAQAIGNAQRYAEYRALFQQRIQEAVVADMGMRLRDHVVLVPRPSASVYPITGQDQGTFDLASRPYDGRS